VKLNRTRRGILALVILSFISVGVWAREGGFVNGEWSNAAFIAQFIIRLTRLEVIVWWLILGFWFALAGGGNKLER
jgi:hypothetical protein